ncbi:MAG TPA: prepilin-type N-terminal cleavage/methylation domain-containing protein [Polyangia bacterium]|jgi:Tfp pilus assembly protein PilV
MTTRAREAGMTMIEVLVTLAIMMIGAAGLIGINAVTMASGRFARDLTSANALALSKAEELRIVTPIPALPSTAACTALLGCPGAPGEVVDETGAEASDGRFTRCWCGVPTGTDLTLTVLVAWNDNNATPAACSGASHCVRVALRRRP